MIQKRDILFTPANEMRTLHIYLPDDYESSGEHYPVMYFFDGHNLFFNHDATYGKSWGLKEFMDGWEKKMIIVGVTCSMTNRLVEYCPYHFTKGFLGEIVGTGHATLQWMIDELKPVIDRDYRTMPFRECTAIGGSSMGGLMSLYAAVKFNNWFSKAACLSSTIGPCMEDFREDIAACAMSPDTRVSFLGHGGGRRIQALSQKRHQFHHGYAQRRAGRAHQRKGLYDAHLRSARRASLRGGLGEAGAFVHEFPVDEQISCLYCREAKKG